MLSSCRCGNVIGACHQGGLFRQATEGGLLLPRDLYQGLVQIAYGPHDAFARARVQLAAVLRREGHEGEDIVLAVIHQGRELGEARSKLVGDMPPGRSCAVPGPAAGTPGAMPPLPWSIAP